jgi:hypothetical protein
MSKSHEVIPISANDGKEEEVSEVGRNHRAAAVFGQPGFRFA